MIMPYFPLPPFPWRKLPPDSIAKQHLYSAGFTGSWKSYLFWMSVISAFFVFLVLLDLLG